MWQAAKSQPSKHWNYTDFYEHYFDIYLRMSITYKHAIRKFHSACSLKQIKYLKQAEHNIKHKQKMQRKTYISIFAIIIHRNTLV